METAIPSKDKCAHSQSECRNLQQLLSDAFFAPAILMIPSRYGREKAGLRGLNKWMPLGGKRLSPL